MFKFDKYLGPFGIPIYYQRLPELVKNSAVELVVWVGAKNDTQVGNPGLYHWFEHVPFRGTANFPDGYDATFGTVKRLGGNLNASTSYDKTRYKAHVPTRFLREAIEVVTDLVAAPLLSHDGIVAEREIIKQEIGRKRASIEGVMDTLMRTLWSPHALSNEILGTVESLDSMTPENLWEARTRGYDRSRMAFFVSTSEKLHVVMEMCRAVFGQLPDNGLSPLSSAEKMNDVFWPEEKLFEVSAEFETSLLRVLYPTPVAQTLEDEILYGLALNVLGYGGPGSPVYTTIREDKQLAYEVGSCQLRYAEVSAIGLSAKLGKANIDHALDAWYKMLHESMQLRSRDWFEQIKRSRRLKLEMKTIYPPQNVSEAIGDVSGPVGAPFTLEESLEVMDSIPHEAVIDVIDSLLTRKPYIICVLGK